MDIGSAARARLSAAGLISQPVTGLHVVDDDAGNETVEVMVLDGASDSDVTRVRESLGDIPHHVVRRHAGFGVDYRSVE